MGIPASSMHPIEPAHLSIHNRTRFKTTTSDARKQSVRTTPDSRSGQKTYLSSSNKRIHQHPLFTQKALRTIFSSANHDGIAL